MDLRQRNTSRHANERVPTAWELQDKTVIGDFIRNCKAEANGMSWDLIETWVFDLYLFM
jgi:hypothetical protein